MNKIIAAILCIPLLCSYALYQTLPQDAYKKQRDSGGFIFIAQELKTKGFSAFDTIPPVGLAYPTLLSTFITHQHFHAILIILQTMLLICLCLIITFLAYQYMGAIGSAFATFFCVSNVGFLTYTQCCLTEIMLTLMYALFFLCSSYFIQNPTKKNAFLSGIILGTSLWIKPAVWFFGIFCSMLLLCAYRYNKISRASCILFIGSFFTPALLLMTFNWHYYHVFGLSPVMYTNLYFLLLPKIISATQSLSFESACAYVRDLSLTERTHYFIQTITTYPFTTLYIWLHNMIKTAGGLYGVNLAILYDTSTNVATSFFSYSGTIIDTIIAYCWNNNAPLCINIITYFEILYMTICYALIIPGCWFLYSKHHLSFVILCALFIGYVFFITGPDGCARLRMMAEPALLILSSAGATLLYQRYRFSS